MPGHKDTGAHRRGGVCRAAPAGRGKPGTEDISAGPRCGAELQGKSCAWRLGLLLCFLGKEEVLGGLHIFRF